MRVNITPGFLRAVTTPNLPPPVYNPQGFPVLESLVEQLTASQWEPLLTALESRNQLGEAKYGYRLRSHDGRGPADSWQEVFDLFQYMERNRLEGELTENVAICNLLTEMVKRYG